MDWAFHNPGKIYWLNVSQCKERLLSQYVGKRIVLLLSKRGIERYGFRAVIDRLGGQNAVAVVDYTPNPTFESIYSALAHIGGRDFDVVMAIGGGSCIDTAKSIVALCYLTERKDMSLADVYDGVQSKEYRHHRAEVPIIAVPTTAGAGSEVTMWATVWDTVSKKKHSIEVDWLYPREAWIVPELTASMSKRLTLATGLDALCHAVEAYWSRQSNPIARELALTAIRLITQTLALAIDNPDNLEYRERMCKGALFAGLAFSNTRTTACHALSYPITIHFAIEHGFAAALTLYEVMRLNWPAIEQRDKLLAAWGVDNVEGVKAWIDGISLPTQTLRLSAFGISAQEVESIVSAEIDAERMGNNPTEIRVEEFRLMMKNIS